MEALRTCLQWEIQPQAKGEGHPGTSDLIDREAELGENEVRRGRADTRAQKHQKTINEPRTHSEQGREYSC